MRTLFRAWPPLALGLCLLLGLSTALALQPGATLTDSTGYYDGFGNAGDRPYPYGYPYGGGFYPDVGVDDDWYLDYYDYGNRFEWGDGDIDFGRWGYGYGYPYGTGYYDDDLDADDWYPDYYDRVDALEEYYEELYD